MIEIKNLKKTYKPKKGKPVEALKGIDLKFEETGLVFILGKSGSGKSTLLNLLGGLDNFDDGEIIIKGKSSSKFSQSDFDSYRNTFIGFIFQEYNILNDFTVGANIALAMELQGKKPTKKELNSILEEVDLEGYAGRKPNELSGGQKQRVAIARALIKNPEIIMADEPTGALDSNTGKQVFDTLKKLSKNKLVIVVSHDREFAEQYGDRVIELADGEIISDIKKYIAKPSNVSEGIEVIEDKLIHIKSGYELTEKDLEMINSYLKNNKDTDSFISIDSNTNTQIKRAVRIDDDGNRENFSDTNSDNLNIKDYDPDKFNLIRSKLPLKNSLKIAFGNLKKKPFRLIMTIFLSTVAFTLFGLVNTMSSYDSIIAGTDSIVDSNIDYTSFIKQENIDLGDDYSYYTIRKLTDDDVSKIRADFPNLNFNPIVDSEIMGLSFTDNLFDYEKLETSSGVSYYSSQFWGASVINEDIIKDMGYSLKGNLPSRDNEIVITEYIAETFIQTGYKKDYSQEKVTPINSSEDLIGKTISLPLSSAKDFFIVGILDTNYDGERYSKYKEEIKGGTGLSDYVMYSEMFDIRYYSYHAMMFSTEKIYNEILNGNKGISLYSPDYYGFTFSSSKESCDDIMIDRFLEYGKADTQMKSDIVMFDSNKTTLAENEIIISIDALLDSSTLSNSIFEADAETKKQIIKDNISSFSNKEILLDVNDYITYDYNRITYKVVGVLVDTSNMSDYMPVSYAIFPDGFYEKYKIPDPGKYTALIADMPDNYDDVKALVEYASKDENGSMYILKNCTSYSLDMVNETISLSKDVLLYIGIFFAIFASILLMNFITVSISYRKREIGILRAVGARGMDVFKIFFNESLIIAIINWLIASTVTGIIVAIINMVCRTDLNLVVTILNFGIIQLGIMFVISISVAFVASFFPVYKVSKKKPVEAIRKAD